MWYSLVDWGAVRFGFLTKKSGQGEVGTDDSVNRLGRMERQVMARPVLFCEVTTARHTFGGDDVVLCDSIASRSRLRSCASMTMRRCPELMGSLRGTG